MKVFGTEMHLITFCFVCIEFVILSYLLIYRLARPDDKRTYLNIILIVLLLLYNITGGLLPDPHLPGSNFIQNSIAYGTGFITPCYFPYYVLHAFGLEKMKFHAYKGVIFFLVIPYVLFVVVFGITGELDDAKNILVLPVVYAVWVIYSLILAVQHKYSNDFSSQASRVEVVVLFFSIVPWVGLPLIAYFDLSQSIEVSVTNAGFLMLLALHLNRTVHQIRIEHERLVESEKMLQNWNEILQAEVDKRTAELESISKDERILKSCDRYSLTEREKEIAPLVCQGHSYRQIADQLFISERTVAKHVQNIFDKVQVSNKMELRHELEKNK